MGGCLSCIQWKAHHKFQVPHMIIEYLQLQNIITICKKHWWIHISWATILHFKTTPKMRTYKLINYRLHQLTSNSINSPCTEDKSTLNFMNFHQLTSTEDNSTLNLMNFHQLTSTFCTTCQLTKFSPTHKSNSTQVYSHAYVCLSVCPSTLCTR